MRLKTTTTFDKLASVFISTNNMTERVMPYEHKCSQQCFSNVTFMDIIFRFFDVIRLEEISMKNGIHILTILLSKVDELIVRIH
jgi:hypothetical protein